MRVKHFIPIVNQQIVKKKPPLTLVLKVGKKSGTCPYLLKERCEHTMRNNGITIYPSHKIEQGRCLEYSWNLDVSGKKGIAQFSAYLLPNGHIQAKNIYTKEDFRKRGLATLLIAHSLVELSRTKPLYFLTGPMTPVGEQCFSYLDDVRFSDAIQILNKKLTECAED